MTDVEVVIVGAGFSGLGMAAQLERAGIRDFRVLESADDLGGTWRDNTYPGCACDIPSPLYSFSFAQNRNWTRLFARQPEILAYLHEFARRRGLLRRITFGARVREARWQGERWEVSTEDGQRYRARFLVTAVGLLHHPATPDLPGLDRFTGTVLHTSRWNPEVDLSGKRVAVIGTGASAIQLVPAIVDEVAALAVFQRTPPWVLPKADRAFDARERWRLRRLPPYRWYVRERLYWVHERRAAGFVRDARLQSTTAAFARTLLQRQVPDPVLRARLTPGYAIGCKRLLIASDWYPALVRPHVDVHGAAARVVSQGVLAEDGEAAAADVIVFATGFDAHHNVTRLPIVGRDGVSLAQVWADGAQAYLGTTVSGFPNMFVLAGPNTGLGHNSQLFMIEAQIRYVVRCLRRMRRRAGALEVRPEAQRAFLDWVGQRMGSTVWQSGGCHSWYQHPRTGRNTVLWPDTTIAFWRRTRRVRMADYTVGA